MRFPPPFIFVAGFLAGWALDRRLAFEIDGSGAGAVQTMIGLTLGAGGLALMAWGIVTFLLARTTVIPHRAARALVTGGPYRFSRNPMYVGLTSLYIGLAAILNMAWPLVLLPGVLSALTRFVIRREEAYLARAFGDDYEAYCRRVRRWV